MRESRSAHSMLARTNRASTPGGKRNPHRQPTTAIPARSTAFLRNKALSFAVRHDGEPTFARVMLQALINEPGSSAAFWTWGALMAYLTDHAWDFAPASPAPSCFGSRPKAAATLERLLVCRRAPFTGSAGMTPARSATLQQKGREHCQC